MGELLLFVLLPASLAVPLALIIVTIVQLFFPSKQQADPDEKSSLLKVISVTLSVSAVVPLATTYVLMASGFLLANVAVIVYLWNVCAQIEAGIYLIITSRIRIGIAIAAAFPISLATVHLSVQLFRSLGFDMKWV